jgi:hypothetical protein
MCEDMAVSCCCNAIQYHNGQFPSRLREVHMKPEIWMEGSLNFLASR